jgi:hypothetical protein
LWLPAGAHTLEPAQALSTPRILYLNADLISARIASVAKVEFTYQAQSRAIALYDRPPTKIEVDGEAVPLRSLLPRGQHLVTVTFPVD